MNFSDDNETHNDIKCSCRVISLLIRLALFDLSTYYSTPVRLSHRAHRSEQWLHETKREISEKKSLEKTLKCNVVNCAFISFHLQMWIVEHHFEKRRKLNIYHINRESDIKIIYTYIKKEIRRDNTSEEEEKTRKRKSKLVFFSARWCSYEHWRRDTRISSQSFR